MAAKFAVFLPFLIIFHYGLADYKSYAGYNVYEITPKTRNAQSHLRSMSLSTEAYDFWTMPKQIGKKSVVLVPPEYQKEFEKSLRKFNISYTVAVKDIGPLVLADRILQNKSPKTTIQNIQFKRYFRYNFILRYMDGLAKKFPDLVTVKTIGQSYEKRKIKALHISNKNSNDPKNTILINAGMHGREWIGPATALYIIRELVIHSRYRNMMNTLEWVILPVANPDGYEYTHTKERFWVKNRKPTNWCFGTDINRNFDFHWGEETGSSNPCSSKFHGQKAFSEPETVALKSLIKSLNGTCKFYLSLNSFGQHLLYPWSYEDSVPNNWKDIDDVAQAGASAIRSATATQYVVNSFSKIQYKASGGSNDYALSTQNIPISIAMTLPSGGREGLRGFHPQPSKIVSIASESWIGIEAMAMLVNKKFASVNATGGDGFMNTTGGDSSMNATEDVEATTVNGGGSTNDDPNVGSNATAVNATGNYGSANVNLPGDSDSTAINSTVNNGCTNVNPAEGVNSTPLTANGDGTNSTGDGNSTLVESGCDGSTVINATENANSTNVSPTGGGEPTVNATGNDGATNLNPSEVSDSSTVNASGNGTNVNLTGDGISALNDTTGGGGSTVINATGNADSTNVCPTVGDDSMNVKDTGNDESTANNATETANSTNVSPTSGVNSTNFNKTRDDDSTAVIKKRDGDFTNIDATRGNYSTLDDTIGGNNSTVDASSGSEKVNTTGGDDSTVLNLNATHGT